MIVIWKVFFLKYVMFMDGVCVVLGLRVFDVIFVVLVFICFLFVKFVGV